MQINEAMKCTKCDKKIEFTRINHGNDSYSYFFTGTKNEPVCSKCIIKMKYHLGYLVIDDMVGRRKKNEDIEVICDEKGERKEGRGTCL